MIHREMFNDAFSSVCAKDEFSLLATCRELSVTLRYLIVF